MNKDYDTLKKKKLSNLSSWVRFLHRYAAEALISIDILLHPYTSLLSSLQSPRVLDQPVLHPVTLSIANIDDAVIQFGSTISGEDPTRVELELKTSHIDGYKGRLIGHCFLQRFLAVGREVLIACSQCRQLDSAIMLHVPSVLSC